MRKLGIGIIFLALLGSAVLSAGIMLKNNRDLGSGGTTDQSDYNAPKTIVSDEIVSFEAGFYRNADWVYNEERSYLFRMKRNEKGIYVISEGEGEELKCEADAAFAVKLQQVIRKHELTKLNGIRRKTYGLPPECDPYWLNAEYASNEKLSFSMNGNPYEAWTLEVLDLFAREFNSHGIGDLLPPEENSRVKRFSLEYAFDEVRYKYGEILIPVTEEEKARSFEDIATNGANEEGWVKKAYADPWDRTGRTSLKDERKADLTEEHYEALGEIAKETEIRFFQNGEIFPPQFDYEKTPQYFEFYIEYESGNVISSFSDDPEKCEKFKPVAERFAAYYEDFLEKNHD